MNEVQVFNPASLMPGTFENKMKMAGVLVKSGLLPKGLDTAEKVCVALQWGHELQLSPMVAVNNIAVVNGKPTLSADIMCGIVKHSPEYGGIVWNELSDTVAECVVTRIGNGYEEKTTGRFTIEDAKKANLMGKDVWQKYPRRMLKHRALSYALRDAFPDLLAGLYNPEEMENINVKTEQTISPINPIKKENVIAAKTESVETVEAIVQEAVSEETPIEDEKQIAIARLQKVLDDYGLELHGEPFQKSNACLKNKDSTVEELNSMFERCKRYLAANKGIKIE